MDTQSRIIHGSDSLFKKRGIRAVTMDDIARELGMSKKTLYQYFSNKASLVEGVSRGHFELEKKTWRKIGEKSSDPVHELILLIEWMASSMQNIPPTALFEIQKFYPKAWEIFLDFKHNFVFSEVRQNLQRGVEAGLFRKEMDMDIVARLRIEQIEIPFNPVAFPHERYDLAKVSIEQTELFMHGLVTMKGKKLIYKYLNRSEDE